MSNLTFSLEARPASRSVLQDCEKDWMIRVATLCLPILPLLGAIAPAGWFGRTCPVSCRVTAVGILPHSSEGWRNSGMGSPTEFLTLSSSEWPKDAVVCSLSDALEDNGSVPQRFYLSAKACQGILRRAERRGKALPQQLERALRTIGETGATIASHPR